MLAPALGFPVRDMDLLQWVQQNFMKVVKRLEDLSYKKSLRLLRPLSLEKNGSGESQPCAWINDEM